MAMAFAWGFRSGIYQNCSGDAFTRVYLLASTKNLVSWYPYLADFYVPSKIQSGEYSKDGAKDEYGYESYPTS